MNHLNHAPDSNLVEVQNAKAASSIVVVCEHASAHIPEEFADLGLSPGALKSHIAWDPGARGLALEMAKELDAVLVAAKTSRLVYDCNRPPDARDAMPSRSEAVEVPGNTGLPPTQKKKRIATYYEPFRAAVADTMKRTAAPVLVTVHSFTPIFHGTPRDVEIGVLHDSDTRLADALLSIAKKHIAHIVRRNEPYGPEHGVTHTLKEHALPGRHLNVMLEVRNDLIADEPSQAELAAILSRWVSQALETMEQGACKT